MMKRSLLLTALVLAVLQVMTVQAQKVTKVGKAAVDKSAVRLGSGAVVKNTIIWGNEGLQRSGGSVTSSHIGGENGAADPLFRDAANGDFRLLSTSPCIDKGTADGNFGAAAVDLWGNKRTIGGGIDIGAHEYTFYRVHFVKSSYVTIIQQDAHGVNYDSSRVDPGNRYTFKLSINISGVNIWRVKKVSIVESGTELHAEGGYYTLSDINSDVTVAIELDPPVTVAVDPATNGSIRAKSEKQSIPMVNGEGKTIYAFQVSQNALVRIDTVSDEGYYCSGVQVREDGAELPGADAMAYAGDSTYVAAKNVIFNAVFSPRMYPVETRWNTGGSVVVKNKTTGLPLFASGVTSPRTARVDYLTDLDVTATALPGYLVESIKVFKSDGTEVEGGKSTLNPRQATVQVGGISIVVTFAGVKHTVRWNSSVGGTLSVKNGVTVLASGDKVSQGSVITIEPSPLAGYQLKSLQVVPDGEAGQTPAGPVDGKYSWTVAKGVLLQAEFELKQFSVVLETNTPGVAGNTVVSNPALPAAPANKMPYGSNLGIVATASIGYRCDGITVNGVKRTDASSCNLQNIMEDKLVKAWFSRKPYVVNCNSPLYGVITMEVQPNGTGGWNVAGNGEVVYHFDQLRVTAVPKTGYKLKTLTVNGLAFTSGQAKQIEGDQTVFAEFEPELYAIHVRKMKTDFDPAATPLKGVVILTNQVTGAEIIRLEKGNIATTKPNVPYGTVVSVKVECDESYNVTRLDTIVGGAAAGDILSKRSFVVTGETTLQALIKQTSDRYTVRWEIQQPAGSTNDLSIYKNVPGDIAQGQDLASGTLLNVKTVKQNGDMCLYVQDQYGNPVSSTYSLTNDVVFKAKFVKECTVRISSPAYAEVVVSKDGVKLADGDIVPAGSALQVEMNVKMANQDTARCLALTGEGRTLWALSGAVTSQPVTSGSHAYVIPVDHAGGEIVFAGTSGIYYKVRYTPAVHGALSVAKGVEALLGNEYYWFPKGTPLSIVAKGEEGYDYVGTYNTLPPLDEEIDLLPGGDGQYLGVEELNRHLDIVTVFRLRNQQVSLVVQPPTGGVVSVNDGISNILVSDGDVAQVPYGTNLTIDVLPAADYLLAAIKGGTEVLSTVTGKVVRVTQDSVFTVVFGHQYQVVFDENQLTVKLGSVILSNGDYVVEGSELDVTYTGTLGEGVECKKISAAWAVGSSADLPDNGRFTMPAADVTFSATTGLKEYVLTYSVVPTAYGTLSVENVTKGNVLLASGDKVTHGDVLKPVVTLSQDLTGKTQTWYYVKNLDCSLAGGRRFSLLDAAGLNGLVYTGRVVVASGDVDIKADLERKTNKLYVKVEPQNQGFVVDVTVEGKTISYTGNGNMDVPVGAKVSARPIIPADKQEGYELRFFPDASEKLALYECDMPDEMLKISAQFDLKKFKVLVSVLPQNAGNVLVKDDAGNTYINNSDVVYGTVLSELRAAENDSYFYLRKLEAFMKGVDQLDGQFLGNYHIDRVTDTVKVRATFERLYRVMVVTPEHGTIGVRGDNMDADGRYYLAGTELKVKLAPAVGYEVKNLTVNGIPVSGFPVAGGEVSYLISDNSAVKDLRIEVLYGVKKVKAKFVVSGAGELHVDGLPGGSVVVENKNLTRDVDYFTELPLSAVVRSSDYRVSKFVINREDGSQFEVHGTDTIVKLLGNTTVEVVFAKYYQILYIQPDHGKMVVKQGDVGIDPGTFCPGGVYLNVSVQPDEGYELETLTWNGNPVVNGVLFVPEEADYGEIEFVATLKVKTLTLTVEQPEKGRIVVEKFDGNVWSALEVDVPVTLDYWTKIRSKVVVDEPDRYILSGLTVNGTVVGEMSEWTMKEDAVVRAEIKPRVYSVVYEQPAHGELLVTDQDGETVVSGSKVPYLTRLTIVANAADPEGYEVREILVNEESVENGGTWVMEADVMISAGISIRRWEVVSLSKGEGRVRLLHPDNWELDVPRDSVEHYAKLKLVIEPAEGWLVVAVSATGTELSADRTFVVSEDVEIFVEFRQATEYKFPVIFTPNGDGHNDTWVVDGLWQSPENTLEIYNRVQQRIYKVSPYMNDWDGRTDSGDVLPAGSYVYKLTLSSGKVYMGMVSIARD